MSKLVTTSPLELNSLYKGLFYRSFNIAVIIHCYNEQEAISKFINAF